MTNDEKRDLREMVKRGLTLEQILKRTTAAKATVKKYIKVFRPNAKLTDAGGKERKESR